jgi:hypothetical protein
MRVLAVIFMLALPMPALFAEQDDPVAPPAPKAELEPDKKGDAQKTAAAEADAPHPAEKPPVQPTPEQEAKIKKLVARLDAEEFEDREAASAALNEFGVVAELPLRDAFAKEPSPEARVRLTRLLASIEALKCDLAGEWEETKENISYKCYYRLSVGPTGALCMAVTEYNADQQYTFDDVRIKDGKLMLHETFNPGYEFDMVLKVINKDKLTGTATRRSDGLVLKVDYDRVTKRPEKP